MDIITRSNLITKVKDILGAKNNIAQSAISFCLAYDAVATVIPGNTSIYQLESNLKATNRPISKELVEKLEDFYQNEVKQFSLPW
jgi:aryl-alcohol dehydrogenase-like predicted oxidoreductase